MGRCAGHASRVRSLTPKRLKTDRPIIPSGSGQTFRTLERGALLQAPHRTSWYGPFITLKYLGPAPRASRLNVGAFCVAADGYKPRRPHRALSIKIYAGAVSETKTETTVGDMPGMRLSTWDHRNMIAGLEFRATLQLRTPLRVLRWHGKVHTDRDSPPPQVVEAEWEGVWVLKPKTWKELGGANLPEFESQSASDIGPVDASKYFPYLLGIHEISEGDQMRHVKEEALRGFLSRPEWTAFTKAHGGADAVIAAVLPRSKGKEQLQLF